MKDIKTRNRNGCAIKSIDWAQIAKDKIRQANLKTKEMTKEETEQSSPSYFAQENAEAFAKAQAKKHGWSSYGDTSYVEHVLRYYPYGNYTYDIINTGSGKLALPIKGMTSKNITSHFGPRSSPGGIGSTSHQGLDIGFPTGMKVYACETGTVTSASYLGGYGNCIIINHGGGLCTYYAHLSKIHVKKGQKVVRGQFIGEVGSTGNSTGPHLHLGVQVNGKFVNPEKGWVTLK